MRLADSGFLLNLMSVMTEKAVGNCHLLFRQSHVIDTEPVTPNGLQQSK